MGLFTLFNAMRRSDEAKVLVLGLDNAGKTAILTKLSGGDVMSINSTNGYHVKNIIMDSLKLIIWDLGGRRTLRQFWKNYYDSVHAIIFVIDSCDRRRMEEMSTELYGILEDEKLSRKPVLVFANKQDKLHAVTKDDIVRGLRLHEVHSRPFHVVASSAVTGDGLKEGMDFLCNHLDDTKRFLPNQGRAAEV